MESLFSTKFDFLPGLIKNHFEDSLYLTTKLFKI
jgi:hypothetical protein